jgi:thiol-disulfide isomerase/thioredoxin
MPSLGELKSKAMTYVTSKTFLVLFFITFCFIGVAVYTYRRFVSNKIKPTYVANDEFKAAGPVDSVELYFFHTTWCPHCKKAMPVWNKFKEEIGTNRINGVAVHFIEVDCEEDKATAEKFKVTGYPTIKLVKGNQVIEYDAKPDVDTLREFLQTSLSS